MRNIVSELREGKRGTKYFRHSSFPNRGVSRLISYSRGEHQEGTSRNQIFIVRTYITFSHLTFHPSLPAYLIHPPVPSCPSLLVYSLLPSPTYQGSVHSKVIVSILVEAAYNGRTELLHQHIWLVRTRIWREVEGRGLWREVEGRGRR